MTREVASPKSTGGGGFVFEDKVCAWFLAHMLTGDPPLNPSLGLLERIDFQTRPDGWLLDDFLLTLVGSGGRHRCALSVKSNTQFVSASAPDDFVRTAWEQFLGTVSPNFNEESDFMGLITAPLPAETREALDFVDRTAKDGDPHLLPGRYEQAGWANDIKRSLFRSFSCPSDLAQAHGLTNGDTGRLLARLHFLQFDFETPASEAERQAVALCRRALRSGQLEESEKLWATLLQLSAEHRPNAGYMTRIMLLDQLRHQFQLADLPDHRTDWDRLHHLTSVSIDHVRDSIGGLVHMQRKQELDRLTDKLNHTTGVFLLGPSGVGKSAIAKHLAKQLIANTHKCLWFDDRSFDRPNFAVLQSDLQLSYPLSELLTAVSDSSPMVILDGLDRLYEDNAFLLVADLLHIMRLGQQGSPWRVVVTCQTQELPRLQQRLLQAGLPVNMWDIVECKPVDDLKPLWKTIPATARLQYQSNLRPLLFNLKILDLIASHLIAGGEVQTSTWVGESSVASWFWDTWVAMGDERRPRERFAMLVAERQADELRPALPLDTFSVPDLVPLDGLERDQVCRRTNEGKVVFTHDLYGDWARLRVLLARSDDLVEFLRGHLDSPLWHRAVRLYGVYLLEHAGDVERWRALLTALSGENEEGAGDLLIESIIFAADPLPLLARIHSDLVRDNGRLLRRLLGRFLAFATLPDPRYLELARSLGENAESTSLAVRYRYPNWPYWLPMLRFLYEHRADIVHVAPVEVARVTELWLNCMPKETPLRREAAEIGLILGERAHQARDTYRGVDCENRKLYYQAALAGAGELPDEVAAFALKASERTIEDEEEVEDVDYPSNFVSDLIRYDPRYDPDEPVPDPWSDGPHSRVDDAFQEVVLDSPSLLPLMRARPAVAREVILASLIKARRRFEWSRSWYEDRELDIDDSHRWHPPLYIHGPFLNFLKVDFDQGLETIARLVDFVSERWMQYTTMDAHQYEEEKRNQDQESSHLDLFLNRWRQPPGTVVLSLDQVDRELVGDDRVYGWSAGHSNPPSAVEVALMALEQYFYLEIAEERPVEEKLHTVLERARSVALLKVLCDVGKRKIALFEGPLRPLLAIPEVFLWEIQAQAQGRLHLMIGAPMHGPWFVQRAREFHNMEHRSINLQVVAARLFLCRESMRLFLTDIRQQWEERLERTPEGSFRDFLQQLVISFDIDNYRRIEHPEHGQVIVNVRAQELDAERAEKRKEIEERLFLTSLPIHCRQMIDEGNSLAGDEIGSFWDQVQRIAQREDGHSSSEGQHTEHMQDHPIAHQQTDSVITVWAASALRPLRWLCTKLRSQITHSETLPEDNSVTRDVDEEFSPEQEEGERDLVNALTGAAAVFVRLHGGWLTEHPERRQWCFDQLQDAVLNPPAKDRFDIPESTASWTWDCFAAEALPALWAEDPDNPELRYLIARLVFAPHYAAVRILFQRCAEHRCDCPR